MKTINSQFEGTTNDSLNYTNTMKGDTLNYSGTMTSKEYIRLKKI